VKRGILITLCFLLVLPATPALAKKKHKEATKLGPVVTVTATGPVVTGTGRGSTAVANCPPGTVVVGGGFSLAQGNPVNTAIFESYRSAPGSWTVSSINSGGGVSGAVNAYGYCRRSSRAISEVTMPTTVPGGLGQSGSVTVFCPARSFPVSGGFQSTTTPGSRDVALTQTSLGSNNGWVFSALNNASPAQTLTAHVYCLAGIKPPVLVQANTNAFLAQGQTATATTPQCPKAKKKKGRKKRRRRALSAGGFQTPSTQPYALFTSSSVSGTGWASTAVNVTSTPGQVSVTSQGICV